jgi:hypothetical protein
MRHWIAAWLALAGLLLGGCTVVAVTAAVGAAAVSVAGTAVGVAVDVTGAAVSGTATVAGKLIGAGNDPPAQRPQEPPTQAAEESQIGEAPSH